VLATDRHRQTPLEISAIAARIAGHTRREPELRIGWPSLETTQRERRVRSLVRARIAAARIALPSRCAATSRLLASRNSMARADQTRALQSARPRQSCSDGHGCGR
jgi:hypothetical protein